MKMNLLTRAHDTDYKPSYEREDLPKSLCIHCGQKFKYGVGVVYTRLSNNQLIWWHKDHVIDDYN